MYTQCSSYCIGDSYNLVVISSDYTNSGRPHKIYGRDVLHIEANSFDTNLSGDVFIYNYGCIVFWGLDVASESKIINQLSTYLSKPSDSLVVDRCNYVTSPQEDETYIDTERDEIIINSDDPHIKLSFSYGLSQSVKLSIFEDSVEKTIEENKQIPYELIATGKISLSRKSLAKKIGILFAERSFVNLNSNILDTPDFFWKRPKYEPFYEMSIKFLDIKQRIQILNDRLDIIHELYQILSTELQHAHSSRLELIIIYLILIEVVLGLLKDVLKWL